MALSRCMCSDKDCRSVCSYEEVEFDKDLLIVVQCFDGQPLAELGPLLIVWLCLFS